MELKRLCGVVADISVRRFNRTFMELKHWTLESALKDQFKF